MQLISKCPTQTWSFRNLIVLGLRLAFSLEVDDRSYQNRWRNHDPTLNGRNEMQSFLVHFFELVTLEQGINQICDIYTLILCCSYSMRARNVINLKYSTVACPSLEIQLKPRCIVKYFRLKRTYSIPLHRDDRAHISKINYLSLEPSL